MTISEHIGVIPEWTAADRLVKARQYAGLTQSDLASRLGMFVNKVNAVLGAAALSAVSFAPQTVDAAAAPLDVLPAGWRADGGVPIELADGRVLTMFGDTFTETQSGDVLAGGFVHNTVVIGDVVITNAIKNSASGSYFWPMDGLELPDGSLFVLASEIVEDSTSWFGFRSVDTDAFIVSDVSSAWSWRNAVKVDDGPWGTDNVVFLDTDRSLVSVREAESSLSTIVRINPSDPSETWNPEGEIQVESQGVFAPVQTADGWYGVSWLMDESATIWQAETALGPWVEVSTVFETGLARYGHSLNLVDGEVWLRYSNGVGTQRVAYELLDV